MKPFLSALVLLLGLCVIPISANVSCFDSDLGTWTCRYSCCFSSFGCCRSLGGAYWYAWLIIVIFIFLCVCACAGGGYGYRRYYYGVHYPPPTTTVVTSGQDYRHYSGSSKYVPYGVAGSNAPPPYTPTAEYTKQDLESPPVAGEAAVTEY